jgi:hypothetical protein
MPIRQVGAQKSPAAATVHVQGPNAHVIWFLPVDFAPSFVVRARDANRDPVQAAKAAERGRRPAVARAG